MNNIELVVYSSDSDYVIRYNNVTIELNLEEIIELAKLITEDISDYITCNYESVYKHLNKIKLIKEHCIWIEKKLLDQKIDDEVELAHVWY